MHIAIQQLYGSAYSEVSVMKDLNLLLLLKGEKWSMRSLIQIF